MKKLKNENGAITILALVSVLFMISFLISSYLIIANKAKSQKEMISQTREIYNSTKSMEEIYNSYFSNNDIIPIYTADQFKKITTLDENNALLKGETENVMVNEEGKIYKYSIDSVYVLMNNINLEEEYTLIEGINLKTNGYKINIPLDYTWIEDSFKQRGILIEEETLKEETLIKIADAIDKSGLSIDCFTVAKENDSEYVMYLYGPIYKKTYVKDENGIANAQASYEARIEKINLLNTLCDRHAKTET